MVTKRHFGVTRNGEDVYAYTIENDQGIAVTLLDYGATLQSVVLPHKGERVDIALGYDTVEEYEQNDGYVGASIGREMAVFALSEQPTAPRSPNPLSVKLSPFLQLRPIPSVFRQRM